MSEPKRSPRRASHIEIRKIHRLLDQHVRRLSGTEDKPGECEFMNEMTDAKIAAQVATDLPTNSVANIRNQLFGKLHKENPEAIAAAAMREELLKRLDDGLARHEARLTGTEERLKQMEDVLADLCGKHNRLVMHLVGDGSGEDRFIVSVAWVRREHPPEDKKEGE